MWYDEGFKDYNVNDSDKCVQSFAKRMNLDYLKVWPGDKFPKEWEEYSKGYCKARDYYEGKEGAEKYPDLRSFVEYCIENNITLDSGCGCCSTDEIVINGMCYSWRNFQTVYLYKTMENHVEM